MFFQITNQKMHIQSVDTTNIIDNLEFMAPSLPVFSKKQVAKQIVKGLKGTSTFEAGKVDDDPTNLKQAIFKKGAQIAQIIAKKQPMEDKEEEAVLKPSVNKPLKD